MCNAWNHSKNCNCGWGGEWHGAKSYLPISIKSYESYINPNAKCPVCNASVFFYQSPDGGRVFFDELGPPWPKHPCTDNRKSIVGKEIETLNINAVRKYQWQLAGWLPVLEIKLFAKNSQYYELVYESNENKKAYIHVRQISENETHSPLFIKKSAETEFDISFLDKDSKVVRTKAYESVAVAKDKKLFRVIQAESSQKQTAMSAAFMQAVNKREK